MRKTQKSYRICSVYKAYNGIKQLKEHENLHRSPTSVNCTALWSFPPKIICHRRRGGANLPLAVSTPHFVPLTSPRVGKLIYCPCSDKHSGLLPYAILKGSL